MVTKRNRSEYMKKFKNPKWETCSNCYEEMLNYRLGRRLLEQSHNPWIWIVSDSDSDSAGENSPRTDRSQAQSSETGDEPVGVQLQEYQGTRTDVPRLPVLENEEHVDHPQGIREEPEETEEHSCSKHKSFTHRGAQTEKDPPAPRKQQTKSQRIPKFTCVQRVKKTAVTRPPDENRRHPFALYASGEKDADTAGKKTHNVRPAASTNQIHPSALRAKSRREVERHIQFQQSEPPRAKSADLENVRKKVQTEYNPWLTEYMRCFSARTR
ncbi:centriole, cilia and spindle-associated protein [Syngnathus scovelli]|uniref:centriole, cilia and spindle-associated protein n=1 Tax=Syngnathus scovelli TaxID=161590 RepID=UPI0021103EB1|nr:centriole, cilia and spindle-associated protein isoform X2 [Syngnathus scovelli]